MGHKAHLSADACFYRCSTGGAIPAEATERQGQGITLLRGAALLDARYQLDPSELNRSRLKAFLALLAP